MIFRAEEIAQASGGTLVRPGVPGPIGTDTRRLQQGTWFLALTGDRFDGHDYLAHAQAAGCAGAISRTVPEGWRCGWVRVDDSLKALQHLARRARLDFRGPVVALTGSAGKTTTRAMISLVLAPLGRVHQTEGNLNNHIGLPLTILHAPVDAAVWVLELGMNHLGEIALLQDICQPDVRLVTNVGAAHLEGVGSIEGGARAKGELFAGARPGDVCCINADDPWVDTMPLPEGVSVVRFGRDGGVAIHDSSRAIDVRLTDAVIDPTSLATRFRVETALGSVLGTVPGPGLHLAADACAAIAVGVALRVPLDGMGRRLGAYQPVGMRLRVEDGPGGIRLLNDAYNANPISTEAALRTVAVVDAPRRVVLLGDMLELGSAEDRAHEDLLNLACSLGFDLVGTAGPRYERAAAAIDTSAAARLVVAPDADALGRAVAALLQDRDLVLLKGSRGQAMERVLLHLSPAAPASAGPENA